MSAKKKAKFRPSREATEKRIAELREEVENIPNQFIEEHVNPLYQKLPDITQNELTAFRNLWRNKLIDEEREIINLTHEKQVNAIRFATAIYEDVRNRHVVYINKYNEELYQLEPIDEDLVCKEVIKGLSGSDDINLFVRGNRLGKVIPDTEGQYKWDAVLREGMGVLISEGCAVVQYTENTKTKELKAELQVPTPKWIREGVISLQDYSKLQPLCAIYTYPYVYKGKLITETGWNADSQIYVPDDSSIELSYPDSSEEAVEILRELLSGFRFKEESDFENAIALALTPIIRPNIPDAPPLFCITAPSHGSGKSFLCRTLWSMLQGTTPGVTDLESNADMENKLFSVISDALPYVLFDNVSSEKKLDSGLLASFVTEPKRMNRIFYTQKTATVENFAITCYTGTSTEASMELVSRICQIRLKPPPSRAAKIYYKFDPIVDCIQKDRGKYLGALMFMVQKWVDNGCMQIDRAADEDSEQVHRQRHWASQMHGLLNINGLGEHFLANDAQMRIDSSPEEVEMGRFLNEIVRELTPEVAMKGWRSKDIFQLASYYDVEENNEPYNLLSRWIDPKKYSSEHARKAEVGRVLARFRDKPFSGWILEKVGVQQGSTVFRLVDNGGLAAYNEALGLSEQEQQQADLQKPVEQLDESVTRIDSIEDEERKAMMEEEYISDESPHDDWNF